MNIVECAIILFTQNIQRQQQLLLLIYSANTTGTPAVGCEHTDSPLSSCPADCDAGLPLPSQSTDVRSTYDSIHCHHGLCKLGIHRHRWIHETVSLQRLSVQPSSSQLLQFSVTIMTLSSQLYSTTCCKFLKSQFLQNMIYSA